MQRRYDGGHVRAGKGPLDQPRMGNQPRRSGVRRVGGNRLIRRATRRQISQQRRNGSAVHHRISQSRRNAIRRADRGPGQPDPQANAALRPRQRPGRTHIGEIADANLGGGKLDPLRHDAVAAMDRQPDPAAHANAVHHRQPRFGQPENARVQPVFLGPKGHRGFGRCPPGGPQRLDIATRTQGTVAFACQRNRTHGRVSLQPVQPGPDQPDHLQVQAVQHLGAVQVNPAQRPLDGYQDGCGHVPCTSERATISRMISLVPSRI